MDKHLDVSLTELYRIFYLLNEKYYTNKLPHPVITIQPTKKNIAGWCSRDKIWKHTNNDEDQRYEINICAHYLGAPAQDLVEVMQHEMVHLFNLVNNTNDCKHNKRFKTQAEKADLICEKSKQYGWGYTSINEKLKQFIEEVIKPNQDAFKYVRKQETKITPVRIKKIFKYTCPQCGLEAKAKEETKITCTTCSKQLEMEPKEEQ